MIKQFTATKTTHALRSPYPEPGWPTISTQTENQIIDTLLPLLAPIGEHRRKSQRPSKGKGRKRLKTKHVENTDEDGSDVLDVTTLDIQHHLTVGFNSTVRKLESFITNLEAAREPELNRNRSKPKLFTIFVCLSCLPPVLTAPLPLLAATASTSPATDVRLVPVSQVNALRIATTLRQPQANFIGVSGEVRGTEELQELICTNIGKIQIPWIRPPTLATYEPLKVHSKTVAVDKTPRSDKGKRKAGKIS